jgi:hypothetical protein
MLSWFSLRAPLAVGFIFALRPDLAGVHGECFKSLAVRGITWQEILRAKYRPTFLRAKYDRANCSGNERALKNCSIRALMECFVQFSDAPRRPLFPAHACSADFIKGRQPAQPAPR